MRGLLGMTIAAVLATRLAGQAPPTVRLGGETLQGVALGAGSAVFRGLPYAAPPVGALRWKPPLPWQPGQGIRQATAFAPACMQRDAIALFTRGIAAVFGTQDRIRPAPFRASEDCLYLNVWTTNLGSGRPGQPVMVWIHGGSNLFGEGASPLYDGAALARRGIVVVTINYRLGVFGFLAHPALTAESAHRSSGNYGLLDQLEALRWVRAHIATFGGDPDRVTVFGESAGAIDIMHLMASPLARGLFQRAIAESGAPMAGMASLAEAEGIGTRMAQLIGGGSASDELATLRSLTAEQILAAGDRLLASGGAPGPVVDGWVLPDRTGRTFASGRQLAVPLLLGSNALEMTTLRTYLPRFPRTVAGYRDWMTGRLGPLTDRMWSLYPAESDAAVEPALLRIMTDLTFTCPARFAARAMALVGTKAYQYQFTRVLPGGESLGAYHAAEINYVFGNWPEWLPHEPVDATLGEAMQTYWSRFAATGDPNGPGLPRWPAHEGATDQHLEFGTAVGAGSGLLREACDVVALGLPATWDR